MNHSIRKLSGIVLAVAGLALGAAAQAQTSSTTTTTTRGMSSTYGSSSGSGTSWYAPAGGRYIGFNAGVSDFPGDDEGDSYSLYTGGMWNQMIGLEFGATDFGNAGNRDAYGFSLSAVGRIPLTPAFSVFGKLGGMYSRTDTGGLVGGGKDSGWGETYGVGVDFNFTQNLTAVLQYDRSNLRFADGKDHVNVTSVGLKLRY